MPEWSSHAGGFSGPTDGPIEVTILNPHAYVALGVLSEGDHHVGIDPLPWRLATKLGDDPVFTMDGNQVKITLPDVELDPTLAQVRLFVPAGSNVTYQSHSGMLDFHASRDPRHDWWLRPKDQPSPPLNLTYSAENGTASIVGVTGIVGAFDRAGSVHVFTDGGVANVTTSTGTIRASGTGELSLHARDEGSSALLSPPCDLDLTVHPGEGKARFGYVVEAGVPLAVGTYHAAAPFTTSLPPEGGRVVEKPVLTVTSATSSRREAPRTASAVLAGPSESGRTTGHSGGEQVRPAGLGGSSARVSDRAEGRRPRGA